VPHSHTGPMRPLDRQRAKLLTVVAGLLLAMGFLAGAQETGPPASGPAQPAALLAAAPSTSSTTAPPDTGNPTATITAPVDGATYPAGTAITLTATFSADLRTALQAGTNRACYFNLGDDANTITTGTIDLTAGTCTGRWSYSYAAAYTLTAWIQTPSKTTYSSPPITVNITSGTNPRCTGQPGAPSSCVYRWAEVYYNSSDTRYQRVCSIDGGCQWQTSHTSWQQVPGSDYWINSTGQPLPDGNQAEAYPCLGSSPTAWTSYTSTHNLDTLQNQPDTSAKPVPTGTC
jgi:hypothetical protein